MKKTTKLLFIIVITLLTISLLSTTVLAFANTWGDFTNDEYAYNVVTDTLGQYYVNIYDIGAYTYPITDITTQILYSDTEGAATLTTLVISLEDGENGIFKYKAISDNLPTATLEQYSDEDMQDLEYSISVYTTVLDGVYNINVNIVDNVGYIGGTLTIDLYNIAYGDPNIPSNPTDDFNTGYDQGYQDGINSGIIDDSPLGFGFNVLGGIFAKVGSILSIELFPGFSIGLIIAIPVTFCLLKWFLDVVRG